MDIFGTQTRKTIAQGCSVKNVVLKIWQNSQKKIGVGVSSNKVAGLRSIEFYEIFSSTFVSEHLWVNTAHRWDERVGTRKLG